MLSLLEDSLDRKMRNAPANRPSFRCRVVGSQFAGGRRNEYCARIAEAFERRRQLASVVEDLRSGGVASAE